MNVDRCGQQATEKLPVRQTRFWPICDAHWPPLNDSKQKSP